MNLSIDIGGTKISAGLVAENYSVFNYLKYETPKNSKAFFKLLSEIIKKYKQDYDFQKIGIGCAGLVDENGIIAKSPNLPFLNGINLSTFIKEGLEGSINKDTQIKICNDAACFTLAEAICGAGKNKKIVLGITIGTGLGGGIVIDKKLLRGSQGFAGEFGHINIQQSSKQKCRCGNYGCLEQFVSGKALERYYKKISSQNKTSQEIENLSYSGDTTALQAINQLADFLSVGLTNLIHILNPEIIVIGGSVGKTKTLFTPLSQKVRSRLISDKILIQITQSELSDNAVLIGASLI